MAKKHRKHAKIVDQTQDPIAVEHQLEKIGIVQQPDGGYGWAIVAASFTLNMIVDGVIFTVGKLLLDEWTKQWPITVSAASLSMSILTGCYFFIGPIASVLCNVFGCRSVAAAGSLIAATGFLLSTIAPNIKFLYFSFGIIGGMGFGMMYLPSIVMISHYFAKKRAMATGIAVCGSGIGNTIFPYINTMVFEFLEEDWRKFLLFIGFLSATGIFPSFILKPLKASEEQIDKVAMIVENYEENKKKNVTNAVNPDDTPLLNSIEAHAAEHHVDFSKEDHEKELHDVISKDLEDVNNLEKKDAFFSGNVEELAARQSRSRQNTLTNEEAENMHDNAMNVSTQNLSIRRREGKIGEIINALRRLLDRELLFSYAFQLLAFSGTFTVMCSYVPFIYLGFHLERVEGLSTFQKNFPISFIGMSNIFFRIVCGRVADHPSISALQVSNFAIILSGLSTICVPFCTEYWHFIVFCVVFSSGVACFAALRSAIAVELVGLDKLSDAFGILMVYMGIGAVFGSPTAAFLKDLTGDYNTSFFVLGSVMVFSGIMTIFLPQIQRWETQRRESRREQGGVEMALINSQ